MCAQKISSIVWGWPLSTDFVYGTDCFCEVVCSGEPPGSWGLLAVKKVRFTGSPECGQEGPQRRRSPGDFWSLSGAPSKSNTVTLCCFILFYLPLFFFTLLLICFNFILFYCVCVCVCVCVCACVLSCFWLFVTPWTVTHKASDP